MNIFLRSRKISCYSSLLLSLIYFSNANSITTFRANAFTGWTPPDLGFVVGHNRFLSCINGACSIFNRTNTNTPLATSSLNNIFQNVRIQTIFDPRVLYDTNTERFIILATDGIYFAGSQIVFAVSKTATPSNLSTDWYTYAFRASESDAVWADFPSVGQDIYNVYVSVNMFSGTGKAGDNDIVPRFWVVPKNKLYDGTLHNSKTFPNKVHKLANHFTMVPATAPYDTSLTKMYIATYRGSNIGLITVDNINDYSKTTITAVSLSIPPYYHPSQLAAQKGSSTLINHGGLRTRSAIYHNGYIWMSQTASPKSGQLASVKWDRVNVATRTLEASGYFNHKDADGSLYFPDLNVDIHGNANFIMVGSSSNEYISSYIAAVCADGSIHEPVLGKAGLSTFITARYGDYSDLSVDPVDRTTFWGGTQIPTATNRWEIYAVGWQSLCDPDDTNCEFDCTPHGTCNVNTKKCVCATGWTGNACSECADGYYGPNCNKCPDCIGNPDHPHGSCKDGQIGDGTCICNGKWEGPQCDSCAEGYFNSKDIECLACLPCQNGVCDASGMCACDEGWAGMFCHICASGYYGSSCLPCPDCGDHGSCVEGICQCDTHYTGTLCDTCTQGRFLPNCIECPITCNNGKCVEGLCVCNREWMGEVCDHCNPQERDCDVCNCGLHGTCIDKLEGTCVCDTGWALPNCDHCQEGYSLLKDECIECPDCGEHGKCVDGTCQCEHGWTTVTNNDIFTDINNNIVQYIDSESEYCNTCKPGFFLDSNMCIECPNCNHGTCNVKGRCDCMPKWSGADCSECDENYWGPNCSLCPDCGLNGVCNEGIEGDGKCNCHEGWGGLTCDRCVDNYFGAECQKCPDCVHGACNEAGLCECNEGWEGFICNRCTDNFFGSKCEPCSKCINGKCQNGICDCYPAWEGHTCTHCINDTACHHGTCSRLGGASVAAGTCECLEGWEGPDCNECSVGNKECTTCEDDPCLCTNGVCGNGKCSCNNGWEGANCNECLENNDSLLCPWINCGLHGHNTSPNVCLCDNGWDGRTCDTCVSQIINLECKIQ